MNKDIFKRLLKKIEFGFKDGVVSGYFENEYYYIDIVYDFVNCTGYTHFEDYYNRSKLKDSQEQSILFEMNKIYKQHENEYKQNLKENKDFLGCNIIN